MFGLSFLSPAFLLGALVAAVPLALHLLGRRPRVQVPFPAVRLLKRVPAEQTRRRRLRDLLLLALRVGALALLAIAFARPYLVHAARAGEARSVVIALDRSFSMSAPGQAERARALARAALGEVPASVPVAVVAFDDEPAVLVKPTTDRAVARQAIDGVRPGFGGTSYSAALARCADLLGGAPGRVVVVTDLQRTGWERQDAAISDRVDVAVRDVGAVASNLAVSDLRRQDDGVGVTVRNSGAKERAGKVRLNLGGHVEGVLPFTLAGGSVQRMVFRAPGATTGEAIAELDDVAGYQADNRAYALLDPLEVPTLLAITSANDPSRGAFYLRHALEVADSRFFRVEVADAASFSRVANAANVRRYAAVILLGTRGLDDAAAATLRDYVAGGNGMFVSVSDQVEPAVLDAVLGTKAAMRFEGTAGRDRPLSILSADSRHPLMQSLGPDALTGARFERVAQVEVPNEEIVARFADGTPALAEVRQGKGRVLLFGSDLSNRWNDLPLQPVFLPLTHEIARYLAAGRIPERNFTVAQVPAGFRREPGIQERPAGSRVVVNVAPAESDVTRMTAAEFTAAITRRARSGRAVAPADPLQAAEQQRLWRAAIALAIVALLVESALGRTRSA